MTRTTPSRSRCQRWTKAHSSDPACYGCHKTARSDAAGAASGLHADVSRAKDPAQTSCQACLRSMASPKTSRRPKSWGKRRWRSHPRWQPWRGQKLFSQTLRRVTKTILSSKAHCVMSQAAGNNFSSCASTADLSAHDRNATPRPLPSRVRRSSHAPRPAPCAAMATRLGPNLCAPGTRAQPHAAHPQRWYYHAGGTAPSWPQTQACLPRRHRAVLRSFADYVVDSTVTGKPSRYQSKMPDAALGDLADGDGHRSKRRTLSGAASGSSVITTPKRSRPPASVPPTRSKSTFVLACIAHQHLDRSVGE